MTDVHLTEVFLKEADELIHRIDEALGLLEKDYSPEVLQDLFRTAHTLKGAAALVQQDNLSNIAHLMEDVIENLIENKITYKDSIHEWLIETSEAIKSQVSRIAAGKGEDKTLYSKVKGSLERIENKEKRQKVQEVFKEKEGTIREEEPITILSTPYLRIKYETIEGLIALIGELTIINNYFVSEAKRVFEIRDEIEYSSKRLLKEIMDFSSRYAYSLPEKVRFMDELLEEFKELEFDRYDDLNLFARKLQEITSDIIEALQQILAYVDNLSEYTKRLDQISVEMRDLATNARMVNIGRLFSRFKNTIRDLSKKYNKKINFITEGGDTYIDRAIYDRLFTPLLHVVRNAVAHGIESPEDRVKKGKPSEGRIALVASREGNSIVIDVRDDGRGIDTRRIYERAFELGLLKKGERVKIRKLMNFLFLPGFSTSQSKDTLSGRGVGLDIVRKAIEEINGTVNIFSVPDKGTIVRIRLPMSLIVFNVMKFRVGDIGFVVPSTMITELIEVEKDQELIRQGKKVKVLELSYILGIPTRGRAKKSPAMIFRTPLGEDIAFAVDELYGQEDTVIKPMPGFLQGLYYYSGVSITADGRLLPVLNVSSLLELAESISESASYETTPELDEEIMVVDDSISVRKFLESTLSNRGYKVVTATNGLEALNKIYEKNIKLLITDLEMPVMHGYELLRELQRRGLSEKFPILILTSRGSKKHYEKALSLGATDYLVKPLNEEDLMDVIQKYVTVS